MAYNAFSAAQEACKQELLIEHMDMRTYLVVAVTFMISAGICLASEFTVGGILCCMVAIGCIVPVINKLQTWKDRMVALVDSTSNLNALLDM